MSRKRNSPHPATNGSKWIRPTTRWAIYHRDDFRCVYCESMRRLTLDHLNSVHNGGVNCPTNLVTSCLTCNSRRQGLSVRAWYKLLRSRHLDTENIRRRIRRQRRKPLDREVGAFLVRLRGEDADSED